MTAPSSETRFIQEWQAGLSVRMLAERYGKSLSAIERSAARLRRAGVALPVRGSRPSRTPRPVPRVPLIPEARTPCRVLDAAGHLIAVIDPVTRVRTEVTARQTTS